MTVTMGIDVGTYETKGVLVEDGRILAEARRAHGMDVPSPGWAEHDAEAVWWGETAAVARDLTARGPAPAALAVSAIGPCLLPVGEDGAALRPGILYGVDTRATDEIVALNDAMGEAAILARGGNALTSQSVGPKIAWLRRHEPEVWARTRRLHSATSFIVERLTGAHVMDRYTAAGWGPLYDIGRGEWAEDLAGVCDEGMLPALRWSSEVAGGVTAEASAATGLAAGTPVTVGTIDAAAEAVSAGVERPGDMMIMYGSTVFVIAVTDAPVADPRLWAAPWLFPGGHAVMAGLATSGTLIQWLRGLLLPGMGREEAFALLAREAAASPPGANGLICLPYFSGERTPLHDPLARGAFFGLHLGHGRGDMARAAIEGIAHATRHALDAVAEAGVRPARVAAVGGGTRNPVWLQATSDMTGLAQDLPTVTLGAAYGDAFLAALAVGVAAPRDMRAWNPVAARVEPARVPAYEAAWPLFRALHEATRPIMHALP